MATETLAKYHCNYCQEDIIGIRVKCMQCVDFDLCLQCFSCGAEIGEHRSDHNYQFVAGLFQDTGTFGVFESSSWSAREEMHLLDAIEQFGYGNFEDTAKHIESKLSDDAKLHFIEYYINGNIGKFTWAGAFEKQNLPIDHTSPDNGPLSPSLTSRLPPLDVSPEEAIQLGYMPQRDDFEREYDNDVEQLVSQLNIGSTEDEDIDVALKLSHVDIYTRHLRERARRKRVSRDYQLVAKFFDVVNKEVKVPANKKRSGKDDKDVEEQLRPFTQFHTAQEHENFVWNLQKAREMRQRIRELMRYRRNGLTKHRECLEYERARFRREKKKENKKKNIKLSHFDYHQLGQSWGRNVKVERIQKRRKKPRYFNRKKIRTVPISLQPR